MKQKRSIWIYPLLVLGFLLISTINCSKSDDNPSKADDNPSLVPELTTSTVSTITSTTANCGGNITSNGGETVTARGVCWSMSQNPTIADSKTSDGTGTGTFTSSITGLTPGATYYFRAYATNSIGTAYGNQVNTTTTAVLPVLTTTTLTSVTSTSAISGGNITSDGGATVSARGVCWSASQTPTVSDNKTNDGVGEGNFTSEMSGLTPETKYYVRAYATNSVGTSYGNELSFTTEPEECALVCDIGTEFYSIIISCESGSVSTIYNDSTEYQYDSNGNLSGIKLNLNQTRTYVNTNNTYTIVGVIEVNVTQNTESHNITVSGGRFTNPQTCSN